MNEFINELFYSLDTIEAVGMVRNCTHEESIGNSTPGTHRRIYDPEKNPRYARVSGCMERHIDTDVATRRHVAACSHIFLKQVISTKQKKIYVRRYTKTRGWMHPRI